MMEKSITRVAYRPAGLWEHYDFLINSHFWRKCGIAQASESRSDNLLDLCAVLEAFGIVHWIFGKTLLGLVQQGALIDDHDDDVGVFITDAQKVLSDVKAELECMGFTLIRAEPELVSFERHYRYVDICIFGDRLGGRVGYQNKQFSSRHFRQFEHIEWRGHKLPIPSDCKYLLSAMYPTSKFGILVQRLRRARPVVWLRRKCSVLPLAVADCLPMLLKHVSARGQKVLFRTISLIGIGENKLSELEFRKLRLEPDDSFNWKWRARHLGLITDGARLRSVSEIADFLSDSANVSNIERHVQETDTTLPFMDPVNLDMEFWWGGNNYFWYCAKYSFRRGVTPYSQANQYIRSKAEPALYSAAYYEGLQPMSDKEIAVFLAANPIVVQNGAVISGKHRVVAMIGRLATSKPYIPIRAITIGNIS